MFEGSNSIPGPSQSRSQDSTLKSPIFDVYHMCLSDNNESERKPEEAERRRVDDAWEEVELVRQDLVYDIRRDESGF